MELRAALELRKSSNSMKALNSQLTENIALPTLFPWSNSESRVFHLWSTL